jgi:REP element-mobilizing transposase RayT
MEKRVPQSLSNILIHIIFSTKNRAPLIPTETAPDLNRYVASISQGHGCPAHQIGGTQNHIHVCCSLARTQTCAKLVEEIKTGFSKWMKAKTPPLRGSGAEQPKRRVPAITGRPVAPWGQATGLRGQT